MRRTETAEGRSVRLLRIGEQVRHVLSELLQRGDVHDDVLQSHLVSVTEVRMSPDLRHATVFVKPLLGQDEEAVLKALRQNTAFLQRGWKLTDKAIGDLNGDRVPDAVLALWMDDPRNNIHPSYDPKTRYDTNPMMLVVLFGDRNGGYDLASANHALIPRRVNPNQD